MGGTYFVQTNNEWAFDYDHEENVEKGNILIENMRVLLPYELVRSAINQIIWHYTLKMRDHYTEWWRYEA